MSARTCAVRIIGQNSATCTNISSETILEILDHTSSSQQSSTTAGKIGLYRVLLAFPLEYFTTRLLNDLMKRAWSFNHSISQVLKISDEYALEAVTALRIFLKRAVLHTGSVANNAVSRLAFFLLYFTNSWVW